MPPRNPAHVLLAKARDELWTTQHATGHERARIRGPDHDEQRHDHERALHRMRAQATTDSDGTPI